LADGAYILDLVLRLPVVLFALTIHEFMHAWTAYKCGDDTAYRMGRVTLNPLPHLDLIGTLALMFAPIGWAKPVPINPANFDYETRRRSEILVSIAGVASNFALGIGFALIFRFFGKTLDAMPKMGHILLDLLYMAIYINFALAVFNLLPIPPLDGSQLLRELLPLNAAIRWADFCRRYSGPGPFSTPLLGFVAANMFIFYTTGISILAYPILKLMSFVTGYEFL